MKLQVLKKVIYFSKYRNFSGGNFSLTLSTFKTSHVQNPTGVIVCQITMSSTKSQVIEHKWYLPFDGMYKRSNSYK